MIHDLGGTLRACTPEQTLQKLQPLLLDVFGITRIADITGLDTIGIPVSICIRPNSKVLSTAQGKGITAELARISAIMESIEAWHAERIIGEVIYSSYDELAKITPLPRIDHLMQSFISYPDVCSRSLPWLKVYDLMQQKFSYLPFALISLDTTAIRVGQELFMGTSNGLAGGNTLEEAICHGLQECIERDCIAEFERLSDEEKSQRRVRLASIDSMHNQALIARIHHAGFKLYVFEATNRFKVSCFYAEVDDEDSVRGLGAFSGFGAHLSREVALSRAISEAVQSRLTIISGTRDDIMPKFYHQNSARHSGYEEKEHLDYALCHSDPVPTTFKACIDLLLSKLQQQAIQQVLMYDHTRPELDIAIANVIVPELDFEWRSHRMIT